MNKSYHVYFMTNKSNAVLYIGITSNIERRVYEHKQSLIEGFTKNYNCKKLVYLEEYMDAQEAISREKQLKRWVRRKKDALVNSTNPQWRDLSTSELRSFAQDDKTVNS